MLFKLVPDQFFSRLPSACNSNYLGIARYQLENKHQSVLKALGSHSNWLPVIATTSKRQDVVAK
ncbi:hypothetical protein YPPY64_4163, partial [Yersinia pestis PY-64]